MSRAFREPTRSDFENNLNIQPEELVDYEFGWKYKSEKFYFEKIIRMTNCFLCNANQKDIFKEPISLKDFNLPE